MTANLHTLRSLLALSKTGWADRLGLNAATLWKWEQAGEWHDKLAPRLQAAFGISLAESMALCRNELSSVDVARIADGIQQRAKGGKRAKSA